MSGETDKRGQGKPQRPLSLGEDVEATLAHYSAGSTIPLDASLKRRRVAFVKEVVRVLPLIAQRTGISAGDITLFSAPHEDRTGKLPLMPLSRPRLFSDIPHQQRRSVPTTKPSPEKIEPVEQPPDITKLPITLEMLQEMSPEERGNTIRRIRKEARISQLRFAEMNNMTTSTLARMETGENSDPDQELLTVISEGLANAQTIITAREERFLENIATMSSREIVYALLKKRGMSYQEIADKIGKSASWADKTIGRGVRRLTLENILAICDALSLKDNDPVKIRLLEEILIEEDVRQISRRSLNN